MNPYGRVDNNQGQFPIQNNVEFHQIPGQDHPTVFHRRIDVPIPPNQVLQLPVKDVRVNRNPKVPTKIVVVGQNAFVIDNNQPRVNPNQRGNNLLASGPKDQLILRKN